MLNNRNSSAHRQHNQLLIGIFAGLITFWGLIAVYRTTALNGQWEHFLARQALWAVISWVVFAFFCKLKFSAIMRWSLPLTALGVLSLLFLPFFGLRVNGMCGWYDLGLFTIQPSEIIKVFYILALINVLHMPKKPELLKITCALFIMAVMAALLLLQPDFGTTAIYLAGGAGALFFSRIKLKYLLSILFLAVPTAVLALVTHPYMSNRLIHFFNPELDPSGGSWHLRQFAIAIARGEYTGVKGNMAVWSNSFLPLAHNDSIFAASCEMLGLCGGMILLFLYMGLFRNCWELADNTHGSIRGSAIYALTCMIVMQTLLHIGVNTNLLPPTGVTLPLVSYGGSSLLGTMLILGAIIIAGNQDKSKLPAIK